MRFTKTQTAIAALILANIIWGATAPIFKWTLQEIPPFTFVFIRFFFSALLLLPFTIHRLKIQRNDVYLLVFISVIGLAFRIIYNMYGLILAPSINELIIASTTPIFLIIGAVMLFHEKAKKRVINGTIISFFGVVVIILQPLLQNGWESSFIGNLFFIIAMALNVFYTVLLKQLAPRYSILTLLFWIFMIASVTLMPFAGIEVVKTDLLARINMNMIAAIVFAVFIATLLAYVLDGYGKKYIKTSELGIFYYVDPFVGIAIANPLLGEQITLSFFIGSFLVFLGIFVAENRIHYHPLHLLHPKARLETIDDKHFIP